MKQFQSFRLDTNDECLWRGGQRLALTGQAFAVACSFMRPRSRLKEGKVDIEFIGMGPIKLVNLRKN
jgi:hypothetical protein